jgi:ascorbate PTS system EIIA or EIIAB component
LFDNDKDVQTLLNAQTPQEIQSVIARY